MASLIDNYINDDKCKSKDEEQLQKVHKKSYFIVK